MALFSAFVGLTLQQEVAAQTGVRVERLGDAPIIAPGQHPSIGDNIQGPSLIRVPDWVEDRLGTYYLYFADHKGAYIRLAYADDLLGPWRVHPAGSLQIADSYFLSARPELPPDEAERLRTQPTDLGHSRLVEATTPHIASPDVHVDDENRRIVMYFHGLEGVSQQLSRVATSADGIHFDARPRTASTSTLVPSLLAEPTCVRSSTMASPTSCRCRVSSTARVIRWAGSRRVHDSSTRT
jgi:hypothetical protein